MHFGNHRLTGQRPDLICSFLAAVFWLLINCQSYHPAGPYEMSAVYHMPATFLRSDNKQQKTAADRYDNDLFPARQPFLLLLYFRRNAHHR